MREVAIIGAGELGGMVAHTLARRHIAGRIRLVDDHGRTAEGKALDIAQAAPIEGFAASIVGSTDVYTAAGADIVVIADRASGVDWRSDDGLTVMKQLNLRASSAVVVCAGASQCDLVQRAVRELDVPRTRVFGSAAEALVRGAAALVALEVDASPRDVALAVLGVPPRHIVLAWDEASLAGFALTRVLAEPVRRRLTRRIDALWPVGPYALACAACAVVESVLGHSRRLATCFVAPDDSLGVRERAAAMPVRLGQAGIVEVLLPELSVAERVALQNATLL